MEPCVVLSTEQIEWVKGVIADQAPSPERDQVLLALDDPKDYDEYAGFGEDL